MSALTKWRPFGQPEEMDVWRPLMPWDPFREMEREVAVLWDRMDRAFGRSPLETKGEGLMATAWMPSVNITEDEKEYLVKAELPEVKKSEIKVLVRNGTLCISGERKAEKEDKGKKFHRLERTYGSFERRFALPGDADAAKIKSDFKDGVLNVHLPKIPGVAPKAIEVKVT